MKKFIFSITIIIVLLLIILLFKIFAPTFPTSTCNYSNDDVAQLIFKGLENMDNMNNVSFEVQTDFSLTRRYYKGNKYKLVVLENYSSDSNLSECIIDLDQKKSYSIGKDKFLIIQPLTSNTDALQYKLAQYLEKSNNSNISYSSKYQYQYVKDDILEGKDCILVKEVLYHLENDTYIDVSAKSPEKEVAVYWIEKSTGFVLGVSQMPYNMDSATPSIIIRNITLGEVKDSDFEIDTPEDYTVIESK